MNKQGLLGVTRAGLLSVFGRSDASTRHPGYEVSHFRLLDARSGSLTQRLSAQALVADYFSLGLDGELPAADVASENLPLVPLCQRSHHVAYSESRALRDSLTRSSVSTYLVEEPLAQAEVVADAVEEYTQSLFVHDASIDFLLQKEALARSELREYFG